MKQTKTNTKVVPRYGIIGAGPSGLAISLMLDSPSIIVERGRTSGGFAGSFFDNGYTFDYGPHIMFSKNKKVLDFMVKSLGNNVNTLKRNNKISFKHTLMRYPFENDLSALPLEDNYDCLHGYLFNPYKTKYASPKNLEQWLLKTFGKGICEKYLFPYNRKVWNIPVNQLSMLWAERIPNPPADDIIKSSIGYQTEGYVHQLFYNYPKRGGYKAISTAWEKKTKSPIEFEYNVNKIERLPDGKWSMTNGVTPIVVDELISTMPIHELVKILKIPIPKKVLTAVKKLIVNPMYVISLGVKGTDNEKVTATYFPEDDFLVNRISYPATFSPQNAPKGHFSIQAEITCKKNSDSWRMTDRAILAHTINGLAKRGLVDKTKIAYTNVKRADYAYVVYDQQYEKNVAIIREWFPKQGIHLLGRFSYFEYINVDGVVATAQMIAEKITGKKIVLDKL